MSRQHFLHDQNHTFLRCLMWYVYYLTSSNLCSVRQITNNSITHYSCYHRGSISDVRWATHALIPPICTAQSHHICISFHFHLITARNTRRHTHTPHIYTYDAERISTKTAHRNFIFKYIYISITWHSNSKEGWGSDAYTHGDYFSVRRKPTSDFWHLVDGGIYIFFCRWLKFSSEVMWTQRNVRMLMWVRIYIYTLLSGVLPCGLSWYKLNGFCIMMKPSYRV